MEDFSPILDNLSNTFGAIDEPNDEKKITVAIDGSVMTQWHVDVVGYDNDGEMLYAFEWLDFTEETVEQLIEENDLDGLEAEEARESIGNTLLMQRGLVNMDRVVSVQTEIPDAFRDQNA